MGPSIDLDYVVEPEECHWTVSFQGQHCGRFPSRAAALHAASCDAECVRRLGHRVRVLVRHADGSLRAIPSRPRPRSEGRHLAGPRSLVA